MKSFVERVVVPVLFLIIAYGGCFVGACTPVPIVPQPDADAATSADASTPNDSGAPPGVVAACLNLRALRCAEGAAPTCEELNVKILADGLTLLGPKDEAPPMACVTRAKTGADVRACAPTWRSACKGVP